MGIKGLTGYVASRENLAGQRVSFRASPSPAGVDGLLLPVPIIIDGSAFIYRISKLHSDWINGGESTVLRRVLTSYISAFRSVHLVPIFVWDGTFSLSKLETVKARLQSSIRNSISYMRAGPSLRSNRGFQVETCMLPILAKRACIAILRDLGVEQRFPGGEADPIIAELAAHKDAYILSQDSDFFVTAIGSRGYIPLDSLSFTYDPPQEPQSGQQDGEEDSWAPVKAHSRKVKSKATMTLEDMAKSTEIACLVYQPASIAAQMGIRTSWLPLVAVLAGNDYYIPPIWRTAGSPTGGTNSAQRRLELVARTIVKLSSKLKGADLTPESLGPFMARVVDEVREFAMTEGQISDVVARCIGALAQYSLSNLQAPWLPEREASESSLAVFLSTPDEQNYLLKTRLFNAYENGHFPGQLLQIVSTGIYAPIPNLEDPDLASCNISCGREIRMWIYALLHEAVGIHQPEGTADGSDTEEAPVSDGLEADEGLGAGKESQNGESSPSQPIVTEYIRRGAALVGEQVMIPSLASLLAGPPLAPSTNLASSTIDRFKLFLHATSSSTESLSASSGAHLSVLATIVALRHLTPVFQDSKLQAWSSHERRAGLAMALLASRQVVPEHLSPFEAGKAIQRCAQLTSTLHAVTLLSECLLLSPLLIPCGETQYDGRLFCYMLQATSTEVDEMLAQQGIQEDEWKQLLEMMEEGLPKLEVPEKALSKAERKKRNKAARDHIPSSVRQQASGSPANMFAALSGAG